MTPEAIQKFCKAASVLCAIVGALGSISCLPFALSNNLVILGTVGIYFMAGAVMMTGGLISYALWTGKV